MNMVRTPVFVAVAAVAIFCALAGHMHVGVAQKKHPVDPADLVKSPVVKFWKEVAQPLPPTWPGTYTDPTPNIPGSMTEWPSLMSPDFEFQFYDGTDVNEFDGPVASLALGLDYFHPKVPNPFDGGKTMIRSSPLQLRDPEHWQIHEAGPFSSAQIQAALTAGAPKNPTSRASPLCTFVYLADMTMTVDSKGQYLLATDFCTSHDAPGCRHFNDWTEYCKTPGATFPAPHPMKDDIETFGIRYRSLEFTGNCDMLGTLAADDFYMVENNKKSGIDALQKRCAANKGAVQMSFAPMQSFITDDGSAVQVNGIAAAFVSKPTAENPIAQCGVYTDYSYTVHTTQATAGRSVTSLAVQYESDFYDRLKDKCGHDASGGGDSGTEL